MGGTAAAHRTGLRIVVDKAARRRLPCPHDLAGPPVLLGWGSTIYDERMVNGRCSVWWIDTASSADSLKLTWTSCPPRDESRPVQLQQRRHTRACDHFCHGE